MRLTDHLQQQAAHALTAIAAAEARDIYAVSFFTDHEDDDPRRPVLTVGYNTETQVATALHDAADPAEARWNYAFWLQNQLATIGDHARDPLGAAIRDEWVQALGLWYDDPDWSMPRAQRIETRFIEACCQLARTLHTTGVIERALGRPVPVVVHELEYYEQTARRTEAANPPGLADEFTSWVRGD